MPPWPSRIQPSGNHAPEVPPKDTPPSLRPGEIRTPALYEPPQLHSQPEGGSPSSTVSLSNRPPRHGRSISHPFPSFFGGSRKIDKRLDEPLHEAIFDGSNYEVEPSSATHVSRSPSYKNTSKHTDGDFVTGNCATCDSTVRWPRRLDVYRCTVCLMVNDLKTWVKKDTALSTGSQYSSIGDPLSVARAPSSGNSLCPILNISFLTHYVTRCATLC